MYSRPSAPMPIGQVLDGAFRLTTSSFSRVWVLALLSSIASLAAAVYQFTRGMPTREALEWQGDPMYWTLYVLGALLSITFWAAICLRQHSIASGQDSGGQFGAATRTLPALVIGSILFFVALVLGGVLLIVPGIVLAVSLAFFTLMILIERRGPVSALRESHMLVWGNWWRTFALLLVGTLILIVLYFTLGFVAALIAPAVAGNDAVLTSLVSIGLIMVLTGIVATPFLAALMLAIYYDLKLRREGQDLAARVGALT